MACVTGASEQDARGRTADARGPERAAEGDAAADRTQARSEGRGEGPDETGAGLARRRTGSRPDELWRRWTGAIGTRRAEALLLLGVTLLAGLARFWRLAHPDLVVFDETFYLKDAWSLVQQGYESKWPEGANDSWVAGRPDGYLPDPAFIVHPPLGKLVIALGMLLFGADDPFGWRVAVAAVGTLSVAGLWLVARTMFRSPALATVGAFLMAIDGHAIVTSRIAILDGVLTLFVILGVLFFLFDRRQQRAQLQAYLAGRRDGPGADGPPRVPAWGPVLWRRPWLVSAAIAFGCASAVKWSGLWFLAVFCVASLVVDALERRRAGIPLWIDAAVLKQGPVSFLLTVPAALGVYLLSWSHWLSGSGGYFRDWAEQPGNAWTGALAWVPLPIQSLWHYSVEAYRFHVSLQASHPYQSPPTTWPFLIRPTAFSYVYSTSSEDPACEAGECVEAITSLANPIVWWAGTVAILFLFIIVWLQPQWRFGVILAGYGAAYLPWLAQMQRQAVFQFYGIVMLPFMILAILAVMRFLLGSAQSSRRRRTAGVWSVAGFCGIALAVSIWFYPVWTGMLVSQDYWASTHWLPGWR